MDFKQPILAPERERPRPADDLESKMGSALLILVSIFAVFSALFTRFVGMS